MIPGSIITSLLSIVPPGPPAPITPLNAFSASVAPRVCYSMMKVNSAYAGACMNTREVANTSNQHLIGFASGKIDQSAILDAWGALTVADWRDQSGNGLNLSTTNRPVFTKSAVTDATGNATPAPDFLQKGAWLGAAGPAINFGGANNLTIMMVFDTLGFVPSTSDYTTSRPGGYNAATSGPNVALSIGTSNIIFAQSDPYAVDGTDPSYPTNVTSLGNKRETILDTRTITGTPGDRYVNIWYNFKGELVSGGCDDRIAFRDRYHEMAEIVAGQLTIGANGPRTVAFNGRIVEVIIYNNALSGLSDLECQRIAMDMRARWNTTVTDYDPATDAFTPSFVGRMQPGDYYNASEQLYPCNTLSSNSATETWHVSVTEGVTPDHLTPNYVWAFSNGYTERDGSEPPERSNGNPIEVKAKLYVNNVFVRDLLFGGTTNYKVIPERTHVKTDIAVGVNFAPLTKYQIVTMNKYTGRRPGQYRTAQSYGQNFASEAAALAAFNDPSTIVPSGAGDDVYSYGPSGAWASDWDGVTEVPTHFGDSLTMGDYAGRSYVTRGFTGEIGGGQHCSYWNLAVQGTSPRNSSMLKQGQFQWKDALLQLGKTLNNGRDTWTSISDAHMVNSSSETGTQSALMSIMRNHFKFVYYRYNPAKFVWYTPPAKYQADSWWFWTKPDALNPNDNSPINGYRAAGRNGDRFYTGDQIKAGAFGRWSPTLVIDTQADFNAGPSMVDWMTTDGGVLTEQWEIGSYTYTTDTIPSIGDRIVVNAGTSGNQEMIAGIVDYYTGTGPYVVISTAPATKTHAAGQKIVYGTTYDRTHMIQTGKGARNAATRIANAKIAGHFK